MGVFTPQKLASAAKRDFCFSLGEPVVKHLLLIADKLKHIQRRMVFVVMGLETLRKGDLSSNIKMTTLCGIFVI